MATECPYIVIIKRTGADGSRFPLRRKECLFGRNASCDLRVQLPGVASEHAKVFYSEENSEFYLENLTDSGTTINGKLLNEKAQLNNMDVFSIAERSFRFECGQLEATKAKLDSMTPGKVAKSPKRLSKSPKKLTKSPKLVSKQSPNVILRTCPLQEANHVAVKDSPRTPCPKRTSLRESLGELRRLSVPFKEVDESILSPPRSYETKENHQVYVVQSVINAKSPKKVSSVNTPKPSKKNSKRVSFGPNLSPERFDKALPVVTPVRKGATPRRLSAPLSHPCISPARRRYSLATPSFVSRIEEEVEEESDSDEESEESDGEDFSTPSESSSTVENESTSTVENESPAAERKRLATPLRKEIEQGKQLRGRSKKEMATPLKSAIKQGFRLRVTKKRLQTPVRKEIEAGVKLRQTRKKLATPLRHAIKCKRSLRATKKKMPTPVRKAIENKPSLRQTKKVMAKDLQEEIVAGTTLQPTKQVMPGKLQEEIKTGRNLRTIKRKLKAELQEEIVAGKELKNTKKKMATPIREEIAKGVQLRVTRRRLPTLLQDEIRSGSIQLAATKKSLKTPLRKEIESGMQLRETKKKMGTPMRQEITKGVQLRKTRRRMPTMLQDEIRSGTVELTSTKKSLKTPLRKEIQSGIQLRETKKKMATPVRDGIVKGVKLRTTRKRMPTMLQDEIKVGQHELKTTKKMLKTPLRKEIQTGIQLRKTKLKEQSKVVDGETSKTPKRRRSRKNEAAQVSSKKLKTPNPVTSRQSGFFPSAKSRTRRSVARRKSTKQVPSYAEILKRPKLTAKRRLTGKHEQVYKFEAEEQVADKSEARSSRKTTTSTPKIKKARALSSKTPTRRKSQATRGKPADVQKSNDDWQVVVNKRKIKKIKRQRAVKSQQEVNVDTSGVDVLFKTPKAVRVQPKRTGTPAVKNPVVKLTTDCSFAESYPDDSILYGVSRLMKTPKVKESRVENYEGVGELFEVLEMSSPIEASQTPSLRRASEKMTVVSPLITTSTPSLRRKSDQLDVVAPLQPLNCTPSLRRSSGTIITMVSPLPATIVSPLITTSTPSLRRKSDQLDVVAPLQPLNCTPSLRRSSGTIITMVSPLPATFTPSLKKSSAEDLVIVESPLKEMTTPSLKKAAKSIVEESPKEKESDVGVVVIETPEFIIEVKGRSTRSSKRKAGPDVLPQAKRSRRTRMQENQPEDTSKKAELPTESTSEPSSYEPEVPRSTRAKRNNSKTTKKTEIESEQKSDAILPPRPTRSQKTADKNTKEADKNTKEADENTKQAEQKIETAADPVEKVTRTTRGQRNTLKKPAAVEVKRSRATRGNTVKEVPVKVIPVKEVPVKEVPVKEIPVKEVSVKEVPAKEAKSEPAETKRSSRSRRNLAVDDEPVVEIPTSKRGLRTRTISKKVKEVDVKSCGKKTIPDESAKESLSVDVQKSLAVEKPRTRRGKPDVQKTEQDEVLANIKRPTRGSRRKPASSPPKDQVEPSEQVNQAISHTPEQSTRDRQSKNVPGIPETPQPMVFTKTKLDPIIEVPTPASYSRGSSVQKVTATKAASSRTRGQSSVPDTTVSAVPSNRAMRNKRAITTVVEEEVKPASKRRKTVQVEDTSVAVVVECVLGAARRSRARSAKVKTPTEEAHSNSADKRSSRKRKVEEIVLDVPASTRARRGETVKKGTTKSNESEVNTGRKSVATPPATTGKPAKADGRTQNKRTTKREQKPTTPPVARATRSRRGAK